MRWAIETCTVGPGRRWARRTILRQHCNEDADAAGVDRLHPPGDCHRVSRRDRREVARPVRRPILRVEVDVGAKAEDVEVCDQPGRSTPTIVSDPAPHGELLAQRRRDRRAVGCHGNAVWSSRRRDSCDCEGDEHCHGHRDESPLDHFDTSPLSRSHRAPATAARTVKSAAATIGETSQEAS